MQVLSNWKLTYDPAGTPLVILAFGQIMEGEFALPWRQQVQESTRIRATTAKRWARGNVSSGISLATFKDHASDAAARLWCLQTSIALGTYAGSTAKLRLEIEGSALVFELQDATLDGADSVLRPAAVPRTRTQWALGGTGWVQLP
jgi:hypothetical protein